MRNKICIHQKKALCLRLKQLFTQISELKRKKVRKERKLEREKRIRELPKGFHLITFLNIVFLNINKLALSVCVMQQL